MRSISDSDLKRDLARHLNEIAEGQGPLLITREHGKTPVVLLSLADFSSHQETQYLLKSPRNADRLLRAIEELEAGLGGGQ